MQGKLDSETLVRQASEICAAAQRAIEESKEYFGREGMDPEKTWESLSSRLDEKGLVEIEDWLRNEPGGHEGEVNANGLRSALRRAVVRCC